jgi:hypothetical protein
MKASNLHDAWASPDNTRLTPKQFSFRLPVHVAAKIAALCEMFPQKSRTQIIADLLTSALDELEQTLPMKAGCPISEEDEENERMAAEYNNERYEPLFYMAGPRAIFRSLANKNYVELEAELGNEKPIPLFGEDVRTEKQFNEQQS